MAMPAIFAPIVNAPRPQKIILGVMGLAVIIAAAYFLVLSPLATTVTALTAENDRVQKELMQARAIAADVARFRREIAALEQTLNALTARLPNERETPPLYRAVSDAAFQSGLAVSLFQPRDAQIRDYYAEIPITLTAEGNYHQFGTFFERMARLPRVVNVGDLRMTGTHTATAPPGKDPKAVAAGPVRGELILATYMYRPVGSPPAPKPGQPGKPAGAK
ncbi:MAG: type 4a pilus biogenesis protein PilO [Candidatus Rokubacteria bacterium]|nr:type 4a pilus biogenesis protein PilO [Candidatus Rokubacteria bacterium]